MRYICSPSEQTFTDQDTYRRTRRPVALAETITPEAYTSEDFFAVERERVFGSGWVAMGPSAQVREQGHRPHQEIIEVATIAAPPEVAERLGLREGAAVVIRRLPFMVDDQPVQLVNVYYDPELVAGSKLEQPVLIEDGVHAELRRLGVHLTRLVEDFLGASGPSPR